MSKYSYVITEGFEHSKVFLRQALMRILPAAIQESGVLSNLDSNGVTSVDTLPATGEAGKIYYYSGAYYVYLNDNFQKLIDESNLLSGTMPYALITGEASKINHATGEEELLYQCMSYTLVGGYYNDLGTVCNDTSPVESYLSNVYLDFTVPDDAVVKYVGRFTIGSLEQVPSLILPSGIHFTDDVPDLTAEHTYEFNILYDTCMLVDITHTEDTTETT